MRIHRRLASAALALVVTLLLVGSSTAWADGPKKSAKKAGHRRPILWVVDSEPKIYLFGTMHIGDPRVLAHPPVLEHALKESGALYTEILFDGATPKKMGERMRLPDGQTLDKIIPKDLYDRTAKLFEGKGPPLQLFNSMKVWVVFLRLQLLDAGEDTKKGIALDSELAKQAKEAGMDIGALETVDEQLDIFDGLTTEEQVKLLDQTVTQLAKAKEAGVKPIEALKAVYLEGDEDKLLAMMYSEYDPTDELAVKLMKKVLDDRNVNMVKRMLTKAFAAPEKTHFVAVGAGHMPGKNGIVALLRKTGFKVRRLNSMADIAKPKRKRAATPAAASPSSRASRARPANARRCCVRVRRIGPFCWRECCCRVFLRGGVPSGN